MFVISGPSGVGKGTVVRRLLELQPDLVLSVSYTTRPPRPGEMNGREYRFVSEARFDELVAQGAFLEWAEVFGHRYGTPWDPIRGELARRRDVVLEIDLQGAAKIAASDLLATFIFLEPPSEEELARRLSKRETETGVEMARRLAAARDEIARADRFDHRVVNDDVDRAAREVAAIIAGERTGAPRGAEQ